MQGASMNKYLVAFLTLSTAAFSSFGADIYTIESGSSKPSFEVERVGFSKQIGTFSKTQGKVTLDLAGQSGSVNFTINTGSIDMGNKAWTAHLSDPELFNVKRYPTMSFKSNTLIFEGNKVVAAQGTFTMLGIAKPLKVSVKNFQCTAQPDNSRQMCSGEIAAVLKRSEFGLTRYIPAVSDEVAISVPVVAYKD
jgi:polyisoprenoid-binding protein YceI